MLWTSWHACFHGFRNRMTTNRWWHVKSLQQNSRAAPGVPFRCHESKFRVTFEHVLFGEEKMDEPFWDVSLKKVFWCDSIEWLMILMHHHMTEPVRKIMLNRTQSPKSFVWQSRCTWFVLFVGGIGCMWYFSVTVRRFRKTPFFLFVWKMWNTGRPQTKFRRKLNYSFVKRSFLLASSRRSNWQLWWFYWVFVRGSQLWVGKSHSRW